MPLQVLLLGFGEVGQRLGTDLLARGRARLAAWDRLFPWPGTLPSLALERAPFAGRVTPGHNLAGALNALQVLAGEDTEVLIVSAVTAAECLAVATDASHLLARHAPGAWYLDVNSAAPETKVAAARAVTAAGGRYVEGALMSPIAPRGLDSPLLLGGPEAAAFLPAAQALGFAGASVFSPVLGQASAAKMCRSVMVKGIEALLAESLVAARHYGVEPTVLASLQDLFPLEDWPRLAHYMVSRSLEHGQRRAEEMREVAATVRDAGLDPWMSLAAAERQDWAAQRRAALAAADLPSLLDALLALRQRAPAAAA